MKEMNYAQIAAKFGAISKKDIICKVPEIEIEKKLKEIFPYNRKKSGIITKNFKSKVRSANTNEKRTDEVEVELITIEELKTVIKGLRNGSAPKISGITYEVIKLLDDNNLNGLIYTTDA
jgi:hypothetical protein